MRHLFTFTVISAVALTACGSSSSVPCDNWSLAAGCVVGHCTLSTTSKPLPVGAQITLTEVPLPPELQGDSVSTVLCNVSLPTGTSGDVTLSIGVDSTPIPANAIVYTWANELGTSIPSVVEAHQVNTLLHGSGEYGVTIEPGSPVIAGTVGSNVPSSSDLPHLLRNLEANTFTAAFFDGTHLLVANGPRIFVYNGIPGVADVPSLVLGQQDLNSTGGNVSASSFGSLPVAGIWSDGNRVVATNGSRILIWLSFPTGTFTPADVVLGQVDFSAFAANGGGNVGATTVFNPSAIDSDGQRLLVADTQNQRILEWLSFPTTNDQPADIVIGQPNFTSNAVSSGATPLYLPYGAAIAGNAGLVSGLGGPGLRIVDSLAQNNATSSTYVFCYMFGNDTPPCAEVAHPAAVRLTPSGGVAMRDWDWSRVLLTQSAPTGPSLAAFVLGQPDTLRQVSTTSGDAANVNGARVTASTFGSGYDVGGKGPNLLVPDDHRLLIWSTFPSYNFEPAESVVGQPGFSTNELTDYRTISASTLAEPSDISINGAVTAIADTGNNRVLLYQTASLNTNAPAFAALGQPDTVSFVANHDMKTVDALGLAGPRGVCLDGTHLVVADTENHRVLIWNSVPTQSAVGASVVLGQSDFSGRRPNHGRGDVSPQDGFSDVDADGFFYPTGLACDGTHLAVADRINNRVLIWSQFPSSNGQPADIVLGEPTATTVGANGGAGPFSITANGLNLPASIALDGTSLWVTDTENNRVVRWDNVFTSPVPGATIGQTDGTQVANPNYDFAVNRFQGYATAAPPTSATSVLRPRGIFLGNGSVFVSESDSNRVHVFDKTSLAPTAVLGQPDDVTATPNTGGVSASSMSEPAGLGSDGTSVWVVDARNSRVLGFPAMGLSSGASATVVVGQTLLSSSGFNGVTPAVGGAVAQPGGLRLTAAGELVVADTFNNRVVIFDTTAAPVAVKSIIGQPNGVANAPNAGGSIGAGGFNNPRGVWADDTHLLVADTSNSRVLLFNRTTPTAAAVVLGQSSMTVGGANSGGPSGTTMSSPWDVCSDGTRVAVVDTGNNRVLVWNTLPSQNGQPADAILGQATPNAITANGGTGIAAANTLATPSACVFAPEGVYVADTANNRVALYGTLTTGASAAEILGQLGPTTRLPASSVTDLGHFAGPAGLAFDGANLYVSDRDLSRVLVIHDPKDGGIERSAITGAGYQPTGGIAATKTPFFTSGLYVSDSSNNQIFGVSSVSRLGY